ncbi:hypothetical protein QYF61_022688 [Mycteria americana]|uniref:Uncharacterized protein n=1 Tax=Mycteria americana TaxID=33587 RepID=A0AAN7SFS8_MYCAM|nr:hypothetical protein QYF61_022688 [Mycteria americana]
MQGYGRLSHIPLGSVMGIDPFFYPTGLHDSGTGFVSSAVMLAIRQSLALAGPTTHDVLEILTQREFLRKHVSIEVLGCRERMVSLLESMALKLWESCSGQLPELSDKEAEDRSLHTITHWLLIYMDTSDTTEGGLAWVKGNYSPGARVKGTGDPVVFSLILPVKEKGLIKRKMSVNWNKLPESHQAWGPSHRRQSSTNFSNMSPSHGLQFFKNCSSMDPLHRVQSFRNKLLQCESPAGPQALPGNLLQCGLLFTGSQVLPENLLQRGLLFTGPQVLPGACSKVLLTSLIGSALASSRSILELAGTGSVKHGGSFRHLLTEATPAAPPPLQKPCHCKESPIVSLASSLGDNSNERDRDSNSGRSVGLYKLFFASKRKTRENEGLLLNGAGNVVTNDIKKAMAFFAPVFTGKMSLQECQIPEINGKVQSKEDLHLMEEDQVRARKVLGNYRLVSLTSHPGKVMEQIPANHFQTHQGQEGDWL